MTRSSSWLVARLALIGTLFLGVTVSASPVGTLTVTSAKPQQGVSKYTLAWTSSAGGAVSGNPFTVNPGLLLQVKFVPGTGGAQPTDLYDLTLVDTDGVDVLGGAGANLSQSTATIAQPHVNSTGLAYLDGSQQLDLVVANAGNAKSGTVIVWIGR